MWRCGRCAAISGRSAGRVRTSAAGEAPRRQIARAAVGGLLRQTSDVVDATEDVPGLAQEDATRVGQRNVMTAAIEQEYAGIDSSCRICWLSDVFDVVRRLAAHVKFSSSATATKLWEKPGSTPHRLDGGGTQRQPEQTLA